MEKLVARLFLLSAALVFGQTQSPSVQPATKAVNGQASERLSADIPKTTVLGNAFVAPEGWSIRVKGPSTILQAPEGDSWVALVDVQAKGPDEAGATTMSNFCRKNLRFCPQPCPAPIAARPRRYGSQGGM